MARMTMKELKRRNATLEQCVAMMTQQIANLSWHIENLERNVGNIAYGEEILTYKYLYLKTGDEAYLIEANRLRDERVEANKV